MKRKLVSILTALDILRETGSKNRGRLPPVLLNIGYKSVHGSRRQ